MIEVFIIAAAGLAFFIAIACAILWCVMQTVRVIVWILFLMFRKRNEKPAKV